MKLTIGMAVYDDFDGAYFTLQSLRLHHAEAMQDVELLLVDNKPDSKNGAALKGLVENWFLGRGRYISYPEVVGTSAPRDLVFREAQGEAVMCMDSHVLLPPGAIYDLLAWYEENPESMDLLSGPLLGDGLGVMSTHFSDIWRSEMWGIWGRAWAKGDAPPVTVIQLPDDKAQFIEVAMGARPVDTPPIRFSGHEATMMAMGYRPLGVDPMDQFEIPGMGLGLFSCRKEAWLGFNPLFRGFGGEEMYIHEKFRKAGRKCLCLGFLKWLHRFYRPSLPYPATRWNKIRNYVLGHTELGLPLDRVYQHFVGGGMMPQLEWDQLVEDPTRPLPAKSVGTDINPAKPTNVQALYQKVQAVPRDLDKHMPYLRELSQQCPRVAELSHRKESAIALAAGDPELFISDNAEWDTPEFRTMRNMRVSANRSMRVGSIEVIDQVDLLFLDRDFTKEGLTDYLVKYSPKVARFIVIHDTTLNAGTYLPPIREFLQANTEWFVQRHVGTQYGLTTLGRKPEDKPAKEIRPWPKGYGPGSELKAMLSCIGINPTPSCSCNALTFEMDEVGPFACKANLPSILSNIEANYESWGWKQKVGLVSAAAKWVACKLPWALHTSPTAYIAVLVEEAIKRSEAKGHK